MILNFIRKQVAGAIVRDITKRIDTYREMQVKLNVLSSSNECYEWCNLQHKIITLSDLRVEIQVKYKVLSHE